MLDMNENQPPDWTMRVVLNKKTFAGVEELRKRVAERKTELDDAIEQKKLAQRGFDAARDAFERAVDRMINEVHGRPELPLFANMSDAIEAATNNPIVDQLLQRLIDHQIDHLNILIVAGWTEDERAQVVAYLDSVDARKAAEAAPIPEGATEPVILPAILEMPAFLVPQPDDAPPATEALPAPAGPTDEDIIAALKMCDIEIAPARISQMTDQQRFAVMTWAYRWKHVHDEKGDDVTMDDLPLPPSFVSNPAELDLKAQLDKGKNAPKPDSKKKGKRKKKGGPA